MDIIATMKKDCETCVHGDRRMDEKPCCNCHGFVNWTATAIAPPWAPQPDMVNQPPHYNQGGIETIKAIEASMSLEEFRGYLKGNVMKYVWRYQHKGVPEQDLKKAQYYLTALINTF